MIEVIAHLEIVEEIFHVFPRMTNSTNIFIIQSLQN